MNGEPIAAYPNDVSINEPLEAVGIFNTDNFLVLNPNFLSEPPEELLFFFFGEGVIQFL